MREVRIFELEQGEPVAAWRVTRASTFKVLSGQIWLTVEGQSEDHWLGAGESIELPRGSVAWISAGQTDARFALASGSERAPLRSVFGVSIRSWLPRWLGAA